MNLRMRCWRKIRGWIQQIFDFRAIEIDEGWIEERLRKDR
jgi:hypothetical protein